MYIRECWKIYKNLGCINTFYVSFLFKQLLNYAGLKFRGVTNIRGHMRIFVSLKRIDCDISEHINGQQIKCGTIEGKNWQK